jgi:chaperonin GroES
MSTKLKPLDNKVVIEPHEADEVTPGGIFLPEQAKEQKQRGTVIAVGPGKMLNSGERAAPSVKAGDEVIYPRWGGSEIEIDGDTYKILAEDELLAVVA